MQNGNVWGDSFPALISRQNIIFWEEGQGILLAFIREKIGDNVNAWIRGKEAWNRKGICVKSIGDLPSSLYFGSLFDNNVAVIVPKKEAHLPAIWSFCSSPLFYDAVRNIDQKLNVTNATLVKVPFDLEKWQKVAAEKYPDGLPKPHSNDPTQWLFNGHPKGSDNQLHIALARLLGYRWPRQTGSSFPDCPALEPDGLEEHADNDGIVCVKTVWKELSAADRLRQLLAAAYGDEWSAQKEAELIEQTGNKGKSLEYWLRNRFFEEHCKLFHQRPFIWHVWDGRKDGFSALVNYHNLDRAMLKKLIYTYLGDWINRQKAAVEADKEGSEGRLAAALELQKKLELILKGGKPYDIFVRWKPLEEQPIGWDPDLNDGVRLNVSPFVEADVLRKNPKINWKKDRGKDVQSAPWHHLFKGDRINDHHLTLDEKRIAREGS